MAGAWTKLEAHDVVRYARKIRAYSYPQGSKIGSQMDFSGFKEYFRLLEAQMSSDFRFKCYFSSVKKPKSLIYHIAY